MARPHSDPSADTRALADAMWASIDAELPKWPNRHSHLDLDELETRTDQHVVGPVKAAAGKLQTPDANGEYHVDAGLDATLAVYVDVLGRALSKVREEHRHHTSAPVGSLKYTKKALDLSAKAYAAYKSARGIVSDRLPPGQVNDLVRQNIGVGKPVRANAPKLVRKYGRALVTELQSPANAAIFKDQDLDPTLLARPLNAVVTRLEAELEKQVADEFRGEVAPALAKAMLLFDLTADRVATFLKLHQCSEAAETFENRIPREETRTSTREGEADGETKTKKGDKKKDSGQRPSADDKQAGADDKASGTDEKPAGGAETPPADASSGGDKAAGDASGSTDAPNEPTK